MGELKEEPASSAQLGAFFAGMTIRANSFPEATRWSEGERRAMSIFWPRLVQVLPPEVKFIADPEGTIMGANGLTGPRYVGQGTGEMRLVGALREVLAGGHLGYEEVQCVLKDILPIGSNSSSTVVSEALLAAFLIGQRMNRETDRELKAYCLAFDDELGNFREIR
jgi:anthranilate phosphoribosyltransferase